MDREFGLDADRPNRKVPPSSSNYGNNELLSLELDTHQTGRVPGRTERAGDSSLEQDLGRQRAQEEPKPEAIPKLNTGLSLEDDEGPESVRRERERMLELIR